MVELKLWHPGRVSVQAAQVPSGGATAPGRARGAPLRTVGRAQTVSACQLLKVRLPYAHGRALVTVRAYRGLERRTLSF
jgi:hypothetical protein